MKKVYVVLYDEMRAQRGFKWVGPFFHTPAYWDEDEAEDMKNNLTTEVRSAYVKEIEVQ